MRLYWLEFFVRGIPEAFLFVFASYIFSKTPIDKKKYLISSVILAVLGYIIRTLPVQPGVNTIINLIALIVLTTYYNKIDIIKSIQAGIIIIVLEFICEGIDILFIQNVLQIQDLNTVFKNPTLKTLYGLPSLLIFGCVIIGYYFIKSKRKGLKSVVDGRVD